jgi:sugar phosphate isomerase/epimerase
MNTPYTIVFIAIMLLSTQCRPKSSQPVKETKAIDWKISLAQWSLHKSLESGEINAFDFPLIASRDYNIQAVEYVNSFYKEVATDPNYWTELRKRTDSLGITNLLIMVDEEGDLGSADSDQRQKAVENHYKWVDAAAILGCHSIRVNAFGQGSKEEMKGFMIDALKKLGTYASDKGINVLIENHGLYSSDGRWVASLIETVNRPNVGTLPDFGNWCTSHKWGSTQEGKDCDKAYNRYQGVRALMPFAQGVSAKSYAFDAEGNETTIDYDKMLSIVKETGFSGYIGIEYEGSELTEAEGIKATKMLLEKTINEM